MVQDTDKYKDVFLSEAKDHVQAMNDALLRLEKDPDNLEFVNEIFRRAHTLKGMAATMDYQNTARLCHALEDVLDAVRNKAIRPTQAVDILFESFDTLEAMIKRIREGEAELDVTAMVQTLERVQPQNAQRGVEDAEGQALQPKSAERGTEKAGERLEKVTSIEVKVERLDALVNLSETLMIHKMRLDRIKEELEDPELTAVSDTLGRVISEVQYHVMQARMVPVGFIFNRFPRMVRDLAKQQEKQVSLEMEGTDIELDRSMIDEIGECLVHLLRNAIGHGIEKPEDRAKHGKPPEGTLRLTATRSKNAAIFHVGDDGAGIDLEKIRESATERGILSLQASEKEMMNAIFSGLSTADHVTSVSGRGFGLNIVKHRIDSLGGTIKVESSPRKGTDFVIEIPLTLAVMKALFVEVSGRPYAVPLASVERLATVKSADIKGMINSEAVVLNEEDIVLKRLNVLFGTPSRRNGSQPIAIVRKEDERLGLTVDSFLGTEEIVIKPLNRVLRKNRYFSGTTITGSGEVVPILDVDGLVTAEEAESFA